jgi:hypothetical protein
VSNTYISLELRRNVRERANNCCEYCLINQIDNFLPFEVDHIISEKHNGETILDNLCWSCSTCNGYKGSDIASYDIVTKQLTPLYNPRRDNWYSHFMLDEESITGLTPIGRVTITILKLNETQRLFERQGLLRLNRYPCAMHEHG